MKKRMPLTLLIVFFSSMALLACSNGAGENIDLSRYSSYVLYWNNGGRKPYTEWIEEGSPVHPSQKEKTSEKGDRGPSVVSACIDNNGNLVLILSNGNVIKTALPKRKLHTVKFFLGDTLLGEKQIFHGKNVDFLKPDFEYRGNWYLDKNFNFALQAGSPITKSMSLYAKIDSTKNFKITLLDEKLGHSFPSLTKKFGEDYSLPKPFDMNSDFSFKGWELVDGRKKKMVEREGKWDIPKDVTLKAIWEEKSGVNLEEFGLYPQSKVTDSDMIEKIKNTSIKNKRGRPVVDNYEYIESFGFYYRYEPVKWVLLNKDGNAGRLLLTKSIVDRVPIDENNNSAIFDGSPLHSWMNGGMKEKYFVFGSKENSFLMKLYLKSTSDAFGLLTKKEIENYLSEENRDTVSTEYGNRDGKIECVADGTHGWWTKTPKDSDEHAFWAYGGYTNPEKRWWKALGKLYFGLRPVIRASSIGE